ncbi:hypothetical protein L1887_23109 [Cichorium endivia]|nr:hypothetical protein L1887_23109 [Cichorium endivia]
MGDGPRHQKLRGHKLSIVPCRSVLYKDEEARNRMRERKVCINFHAYGKPKMQYTLKTERRHHILLTQKRKKWFVAYSQHMGGECLTIDQKEDWDDEEDGEWTVPTIINKFF